MTGPLLTSAVHAALRTAQQAGVPEIHCSLDLQRTTTAVTVAADCWVWQGQRFPYLRSCKERTVYHWSGSSFEPVARYGQSLVKLVPTEWGPPTFEIDGIKMLPTAQVSPYADAERKVALVRPRGKIVLDTCGGLGYFAAWCLQGHAQRVLSFEKNPDVLWLRSLNPWSPAAGGALTLTPGDVVEQIGALPDALVDAVLHDPPRFAIAGELYSRAFYDQLARVLRREGTLFHYTGSPNKLSRGRELAREVVRRLAEAGFAARASGDGVLATRRR